MKRVKKVRPTTFTLYEGQKITIEAGSDCTVTLAPLVKKSVPTKRKPS